MIIARYFVLSYGKDCDGHEAFNLSRFSNKEQAEELDNYCNEGSDGIRHVMTSDWSQVVEYCLEWDRDPEDYQEAFD